MFVSFLNHQLLHSMDSLTLFAIKNIYILIVFFDRLKCILSQSVQPPFILPSSSPKIIGSGTGIIVFRFVRNWVSKLFSKHDRNEIFIIIPVGLGSGPRSPAIKVIRKFFLKHNKNFRWHLGDYEKLNFFLSEGLWEEKLWFLCVFTDV